GAVVTFTATATDNVDGTDPVTCTPASGSTFPVGTTTVNCTATDAAGNYSSGSFKVTVNPATSVTFSSNTPDKSVGKKQKVTYSATVTGTSGTPTGTVTFTDKDNTTGTTKTYTVALSGGKASTGGASPYATTGDHTITATYNGSTASLT